MTFSISHTEELGVPAVGAAGVGAPPAGMAQVTVLPRLGVPWLSMERISSLQLKGLPWMAHHTMRESLPGTSCRSHPTRGHDDK